VSLEILPVPGMPEVTRGDDLAALIDAAVNRCGLQLQDGDVVVVAQKVVSKTEGAVRDLTGIAPGERAQAISQKTGGDARLVQAVLDESVRVLRDDRVLIVETKHGFICANAGIDQSNVPGDTMVTLLPVDSDASASRIKAGLQERCAVSVGVIVSDTFGRPWRSGAQNVCLGCAGLSPLTDYRGQSDDFGAALRVTVLATADELAAAAELVMGKTARVPVAIIRGHALGDQSGSGRDLIIPPDLDLFR
jgi:coenzyme F420-0:L-glutamate ligase / coenzyme F420-1:gamma-L-glutamate ligase